MFASFEITLVHLAFVCDKLTASFPLIYSQHLTILGFCYCKLNKLTSVLNPSVLVLIINCVVSHLTWGGKTCLILLTRPQSSLGL